MSCKHRNVHCPDMRGPLGEYIRATALACKICGSESEILPFLASTYQQAVGRAVGERQRWGSFPRWGRDWHMSPRVHVSAMVGICCGLCPSRAGHRECSWECCTHRQAPACTAQAALCFVPLWDFQVPLPWERCATTPTEPERSSPNLVGSTGVS